MITEREEIGVDLAAEILLFAKYCCCNYNAGSAEENSSQVKEGQPINGVRNDQIFTAVEVLKW